MTDASLVCPLDHASLARKGTEWECSVCRHTYPESEGVVRFLPSDDSFYEGAYLNRVEFVPKSERWHDVWPVWLINNGYLWRVRNNVTPGSTVLELGCAGGVAYFGRRYNMIGADVSLTSLKAAAHDYGTCIQADVSQGVPLADESVDAVASSFFWEHIPPAAKGTILRELRRILRPGGRLIFLYDVETRNPLVSAMRRRSNSSYDSEFILRDGHLGYETHLENLETFQRHGFRIIEQLGLERSPLQSTAVYSKMRRFPQPFSTLGSFLHRIEKRRVTFYAHIGVLRLIDETIGRLMPGKWARMALTVCEKIP